MQPGGKLPVRGQTNHRRRPPKGCERVVNEMRFSHWRLAAPPVRGCPVKADMALFLAEARFKAYGGGFFADTADWVRAYLEAHRRDRNCAILLASHNMAEVERLCDRVILKRGSLIDDESPAELLARYGRSNLEDVFLDVARGRVNGKSRVGS
jgi:hypothetical protein